MPDPMSTTLPNTERPSVTSLNLRVAIVGAGPAGIYAGNILANSIQETGGTVEMRYVNLPG